MPSIEIVCVGQIEPIQLLEMPFAIETETGLRSHRSPSPLWQAEFDKVGGCIYHLGNPALRDPQCEGIFFASELLSKEEDDWFHFVKLAPEYAPSLKTLLDSLLKASPLDKVFFTSDYQFGPHPQRYKRPVKLQKFWQMHNEKKIKMNAFYELKR